MTRYIVLFVIQAEVDGGAVRSPDQNVASVHVSVLKLQRLCMCVQTVCH